MERFRVHGGGSWVTVERLGGRVSSIEIDGCEILAPMAVGTGGWGLLPRVDGVLGTDGRIDLDRIDTEPPGGSETELADWDLVNQTSSLIELAAPLSAGRGRVQQRIEITGHRIDIELTVRSSDHPVGAGLGCDVRFRRQLSRGSRAEVVVSPSPVPALAGPGGARRLLDIQTPVNAQRNLGLDDPPVITWAGALDLTLDSTFDQWVINTEREKTMAVDTGTRFRPVPEDQLGPSGVQVLNGRLSLSWT